MEDNGDLDDRPYFSRRQIFTLIFVWFMNDISITKWLSAICQECSSRYSLKRLIKGKRTQGRTIRWTDEIKKAVVGGLITLQKTAFLGHTLINHNYVIAIVSS